MQQENASIKFMKESLKSYVKKDCNTNTEISREGNSIVQKSFRYKVEYRVKFIEEVMKEQFGIKVIKVKNIKEDKEDTLLIELELLKNSILIVKYNEDKEQIILRKLIKLV